MAGNKRSQKQQLQSAKLKTTVIKDEQSKEFSNATNPYAEKGNIPDGWATDFLDNLSQRGSGHTPDKAFDEYYNGGIKWVSLADSYRLDNGLIQETDIEISDLGIRKSSAVIHPAGTVLMSRDAGVGKSAVMALDMAVSQHFIVWICKKDVLDNWYLYYWLQYKKKYFETQAVGSTIKTIGLPFFKKLKIQYPSFPEQKAIANLLSTWDTAINKIQALIAQKELRKKWLMQQLLTGKKRLKGNIGGEWRKAKLGDVCTLVNGMAFKPEDWSTFGIPIIRIQNLNGSTEHNYYDKYIDRKFVVNPGDILFAWSGSRGTSFGSFKWKGSKAVLNQHIFNVHTKKEIKKDFAFYILRWLTISIETRAHGSAGLVHVTKKQLENEVLKIPNSLLEQAAIVIVLQAAEKEIELLRAKCDRLKEQKKGLMQVLLTGKKRLTIDSL